MRPRFPVLAASLALLTLRGAAGQVQERTLMDRIMKPDTTLQSTLGGKRFDASAAYADRSYATREHYNPRTFSARTFSTSTAFDASRSALFGKYNYRIPDASSNLKEARDANRTVETRDVAVREAFEAGRESPVRDSMEANREFRGRGKSQKILDQQQSDERRKLSIDEIRELLNKNK